MSRLFFHSPHSYAHSRRPTVPTFSTEASIAHLKPEILGKDKNGNDKYTNSVTKQPTFAMRKSQGSNAVTSARYSKEYEELTQYLAQSWLSVKKDWDQRANAASTGEGPVYYTEKEHNSPFESFVPFDWDRWLEKRLYEKTPVVPNS